MLIHALGKETKQGAQTAEVIMGSEQKVLVVDDEAAIRRELATGLTQRGYQVDGCEKGVSALEMIEAARRAGSRHTFVVLDIRLPDIDGLELLKAIKSTYPDLPVVVISGYGDAETEEMVRDARGSAYLDKPLKLDDLDAEIRRADSPEDAKAPRPPVEAEAQTVHSAYVFLRGRSDADLFKAFQKLYFAEGVCYCDAVRGDWDMVLLLQATDRGGIDGLVERTIAPLKEIETFEVHFSERPPLGDDLEAFVRSYELMQAAEGAGPEGMGKEAADKRNRRLLSAYVLLEIDKSHLNSLYTRFYFDENVVYCDTTDGCETIILLIQGSTYDEMRETVSRLQSRPGVLRARTMHIVKVLTM